MVYLYSVTLSWNRKKYTHVGEFQNYYAERNKPGKMEYIFYDSIYTKF